MSLRPVASLRIAAATAVAVCALTSATSVIAAQSMTASGNTTPAAAITVDQPRPFGYVVGDLVTQRVLLQSAGTQFEPASLPEAQRLNIWLERREPKIEPASDGRRWLIVDYQVINAPQALTTVTLPAWSLASKSGSAKLTVPAWPISVAALTPRLAFDTGGLGELRPDRAAPTIATAPIRRQLGIWSLALILVAVAWVAWLQWRNWQDTLNQPFAHALREIRHLDESTPQAWQALHRAFDRTAGRVTQAETLPILFLRAPHLQPLRADIERFFSQSSQRFFGGGLPNGFLSVRALCEQLRRIEKRHTS